MHDKYHEDYYSQHSDSCKINILSQTTYGRGIYIYILLVVQTEY